MPAAPSVLPRRILYYSARPAVAEHFFAALGEVEGCKVGPGRPGPRVRCSAGTEVSFVVRHEPAEALRALHAEFFNLVLLDLRELTPDPRHPRTRRDDFVRALHLLDQMDQEPDVEARYGFHRILVLLAGGDGPQLDERIATLGARGVGRVLRDISVCNLDHNCTRLPSRGLFARLVLAEISRLTQPRRHGRMALCASGGGITGLYFELGALKCLQDCLPPGALNELDLYYGISAGGVICGLLANGYAVDEFMASLAGAEVGRLPPLGLNLLDFRHLNAQALIWPFREIARRLGRAARDLLAGRLSVTLESLVFEYGDLVHAPFRADGFERLLRGVFQRPGCTNDFRRLRRPLYVGATDQGRREHVLFGEPPWEKVPISRAIQASMSINPVFAPTRIGNRFFEDGAVTRTSNFVEAIRKGADLIFTIDPLVPYVSKRPRSASRRGIFYNADQNIRAISFTRFDTTRRWALRRHPEVSLYTFLPANNLRRLLSINPMDHRPFLEIWRGAYLSTLRRIHAIGYRMRGDVAVHGLALDTARADAIAERLEATERPRFADFFPDGRVDLRLPATPPRVLRRPRKARRARAGHAA